MRGVSKKEQRRLQAQKAAQKRWSKIDNDEEVPCADPTMMAISNYENGSTYVKTKRILAAQGISSPPKSTYYRYQKKVNSSIIELSKESIAEESNKMESGASISLDGACAHRRNSSQCHGAFINCKTKKIVAGSVVTKVRKNGDFLGSSNMMETEVIRRNLNQIDKSKVSKFVHDMDNKTGDLMKKSVNEIEERIDPNHGKKRFLVFWNKLVDGSYRTLYSAKDCAVSALRYLTDIQYKKKFFGLKKHVQEWFNYLLYDKTMDNETMKQNWMNVENHVVGNHSMCFHPPEKGYVWKNALTYTELQYDFHKFTQESAQVFDKIDSNLNTNINESLHSETAKVADKNTAWSKDGYEGRVFYSYLKHNRQDDCALLIRKRNNVSINSVDMRCIEETVKERRALRETRATPEFHRQESIRRKKYKSSMSSKPGDYIGVPYSQLNE